MGKQIGEADSGPPPQFTCRVVEGSSDPKQSPGKPWQPQNAKLADDAAERAGSGSVETFGHAASQPGFAAGRDGFAHGFSHQNSVGGFGNGSIHKNPIGTQ